MDTNNYGSDVIEIDLMEIMGLLWHRLWLIMVCALCAGTVGFLLSRFVITDQYQSTTKIYVLNRQNESTLTYSDVQLGTQLTKDFPELIRSRHVAEQVIAAWDLPYSYEAFVDKIDVSSQSDTRIIAITVTDEDPRMAQLLADEVRKVASERITSVTDIQAVNVVDEANLPEHPSSPSVGKWTVVGALLGAVLCIAVILIHFMLDDTIKTADDIEKYLGLSTLGMIPEREDPEKAHRTSSHTSRARGQSNHASHARERSGQDLFREDSDSFADTVIREPELDNVSGSKTEEEKVLFMDAEDREDAVLAEAALEEVDIEEIDLGEIDLEETASESSEPKQRPKPRRTNARQANMKRMKAGG